MSALTLINDVIKEQQQQQQQQNYNNNVYHHPHLHHIQSMPPPAAPPPLPLNNNRHLAKYLSKSSSRIDQDQNQSSTVDSNNTADASTKKDYKDIEKRRLIEMYNDMKLDPLNFHSMETFGKFIRFRLDLKQDLVNQILTNPKVQYWIDRNKMHGFVYQTMPTPQDFLIMNDIQAQKVPPPIRCDLCKFYGHLSHTCTVKELAFKLNNVVLRNGACRCHICGLVGHPAEAGLCPYIVCSFCHQNGHWNFMCPHKDKISRTLCHRCQRYGHLSSSCPDQWRQFDRISTYEQTPYREAENTNKPVYCYQCAQKGHYGYNCPDFHRKYFIRDYHHLDNYPVYFFASASPFVKYPVNFTEHDKQIIANMADAPIDMRYTGLTDEDNDGFDTLEELEKLQKATLNPFQDTAEASSGVKREDEFINSTIFNETHKNIPLKEYIRKWSNWVIDFHWVFTLKYFIDSLPTYKLHYFIKNYPSLDNFILHWMWWSYTLSRDLERFTKDPFRGAGTMPWLILDNKLHISNLTKSHQEQMKVYKKLQMQKLKVDVDEIAREQKLRTLIKLSQRASKFYQYSDHTMKTINTLLFPNEATHTSTSMKNLLKTLNVENDVDGLLTTTEDDDEDEDDDYTTTDDDELLNEIKKLQQQQIGGESVCDGAAGLKETKQQTHGKRRRLMRSKSCNAIFYHGALCTSSSTTTQTAANNKHLLESHLLEDFKSKSSNNSPYILPKLNLYRKSKQINNKKLKQKLQDFTEPAESQQQHEPSELKLNYVHDIHHFQTDELTKALINRLDSYGQLKTTDTAAPVVVGEDDEQDKTIVFELGCCENEDDDEDKTEDVNAEESNSSSDSCCDTSVGAFEVVEEQAPKTKEVKEQSCVNHSDLSKKLISNKSESLLKIENYLLPNADLKNINHTIIVNSLTTDPIQPNIDANAANSIFAKLLVPLSGNKNDKNNNSIDDGILKQKSSDASLNTLLDLISNKAAVKLNDDDDKKATSETTGSLLKERLRLDSTNLIKILLKIDNNEKAAIAQQNDEKLSVVDETQQKEQRQIEFNNLIKSSSSSSTLNEQQQQQQQQNNNTNAAAKNHYHQHQHQHQRQRTMETKQSQNNRYHHHHHNYHHQSGHHNQHYHHHHHHHQQQQQPRYYPDYQNNYYRRHDYQQQRNRQQSFNKENNNKNYQNQHHQKSFDSASSSSNVSLSGGGGGSSIFKKSKSNDMCNKIKSLMSHSVSLGNTSADHERVLSDYSNSLTIVTQSYPEQQQQQHQQQTLYNPAMFSSSSNSSASTKFSSSSSMSCISKNNNNTKNNNNQSYNKNKHSNYNNKYGGGGGSAGGYTRRYENTKNNN